MSSDGSNSSDNESNHSAQGDTSSNQSVTNSGGSTTPPALYTVNPHQQQVPAELTVQQIVQTLMNPPEGARLYNEDHTQVTISILWVVSFIGAEHFEMSLDTDRLIIYENDDIYVHGEEYGLSVVMKAWLRGGADEISLPTSHFG